MNAKYKGFVLYTLLMVAVLIVFESFQQYYYIQQFDLVSEAQLSLTELLFAHGYRWIIWLIITMTYFGMIIYKGRSDALFRTTKLWPAALHFTILIFINVLVISLVRLMLNNLTINVASIWENGVFFFFQKTPIYTLAHGAMLGLLHFVNTNQNLEVELLDLKNQSEAQTTDQPQALSIKIGPKNKIIPLNDIVWIEAYDYCVKIHTVQQHAYAMRNSLKALEKRLVNQQFLRVHRKAIVNMKMVAEVTYNSSSYLTMENQTRVDIAQSRVKSVKTYYE